jgi:quinohemoprotein ethanol dehydrogenase
MRRLILTVAGAALATCAVVCVAASGAGKDGVAAGDWPGHGRDPGEQRYSPLKQITADNIGKLGLAWHADLTERGQWQSTPIVVDGRIYVTTPWSKVYAFDAKTGSQPEGAA